MNLEDFQLLDIEPLDNSIIKTLLQVLLYVLDYWKQQFIGERTRILDAWITILLC